MCILSTTQHIKLTAGANDAGRRLDRILRKALPACPLSLIHRLLRQGKIKIDGKTAGPDARVYEGAVIQLETQNADKNVPVNTSRRSAAAKSSGPLLPEILWRGSGIIVLNKPAGLATHGPDSLDTLVNAHLAGKLPPSLSFKPGPLHRLDKPTSGLIAFSETLQGARLFTRLLREHKLVKTYLAIVEGVMEPNTEETWEDALVRDHHSRKTFNRASSSKNALSMVKALACNNGYTLLEVRIATGRTHQIRSQAASRGHPLAGDKKYGGRAIQGVSRMPGAFFLHAWKMEAAEGCMADYGLDGFPQLLTAPPPPVFLAQIRASFLISHL